MFIVLTLVLKVMQTLQAVCCFLLNVSYCAGRSIILVLATIHICVVLAIIVESFGGLNSALDACKLLWSHMVHFAINTELYSCLLATGTAQWLCATVSMIHARLILLADCSRRLITWMIPKVIFYLLIRLMDGLVFSVRGLAKAVLLPFNVALDDILKLTILVVMLYSMYRMRRLLHVLMQQLIWEIRVGWHEVVRRFYRRRQQTQVRLPEMTNVASRRKPLPARMPQRKSATHHTTEVVPDELRCVVCQVSPKCVVMLPCKHMCVCERCNVELLRLNMYRCPLCRSVVTYYLSVYT